MNLISGSMINRVFSSTDVTVAGIRETDTGDLILGVRPEDTYISNDADAAHVVGEVYGIEPTGDMTYLTVKAGEHMLEVKADRSFRADLGDTAHLKFDLERLNYFDASNGRRIS
jgi:multiple sugar transport system ATP-binding protein